MSHKIFVEQLKSFDDITAQNRVESVATAIAEGKAVLIVSGDCIHIEAKDRYQYISNNLLCYGIIFNTQGCHPLYIELNGTNITPCRDQIVYTPKEFILANTNSLDWNDCLCAGYGRYQCLIDVDEDFSPNKLKYRCIFPIKVRVEGRIYRYNKPILVDIIYKGRKYPVQNILPNRIGHTKSFVIQ